MKPQRKTTSGVALLFLAQNLFFPLGVQAQSKTTEVLGAVGGVVSQIPGMYSKQPASPDFSGVNSTLQSKMNACTTKGAIGLTGDATKDATSIQSSVDKWKGFLGKGKTETTNSKAEICKKGCTKPANLNEEPSCSLFGRAKKGAEHESDYYEPNQNQISKFNYAKTGIAEYVDCLNKTQDCPNADQEALDKQAAVFNCQMAVLQTAVQQSSQALQQSLQANQKTFGDMNQHQKEIGEQMQQVDEILGPDPELGKSGASQFQGLLGLQKQLEENLPKMEELEANAKNDVDRFINDKKTNDQTLNAGRMNVASKCIQGTSSVGGYSLTCYKAMQVTAKDGTVTYATDANGNKIYSKQSCGPYDYISSKIEQKGLLNARGQIMKNSGIRKANNESSLLSFESLKKSISRTMGDYDGKGPNNAGLDAGVSGWSEIEARVSADIDEVARKSGLDIRSMLRSVAGQCFQDANSWKNKQIMSSGSDYNLKRNAIKKEETEFATKLNSSITSLSGTYSDVMSVLQNKHISLRRVECNVDKDNPELLNHCLNDYVNVRKNLQDLLEGNGKLTTTAKRINGGSSTAPFVVTCQGIKGCVTAFKTVRDNQKTYIRDVQKKKEAYVNQSNQMTQAQLTAFTGQLSSLQNSLLSQYDVMKATMLKMGLDVPERPKFMDAEMLEPMEGPDKTPGPFKNPKSMSGVLSGMMQPSGMINFGDTGMRDVQKQLAEKIAAKKEKNAEELKTYREINRKYATLETDCGVNAGGGSSSDSSDRVGMMNDTCADATEKVNSCALALSSDTKGEKAEANLQTLEFLSDVFSKMADDESKSQSAEFKKIKDSDIRVLSRLGRNDGCQDIYSTARKCKNFGKGVYTEDLLNKASSAGSASDFIPTKHK